MTCCREVFMGRIVCSLSAVITLATPGVARAGMPSVTLTDVARLRVETLSFFLLVFLLSAGAVQLLWNWLRADFPRLPRLSYAKAVGVVTLWGLLFVVVLTMISGARELLTPGAWEKVGLTYKLAERKEGQPAEPPADAVRRDKLVRLREALWDYARAHNGKLPSGDAEPDVAAEFWETPDPSGVHYLYVPGLTPHVGARPLAYEPRTAEAEVFVLFTNGDVRKIPVSELDTALASKGP
jgi:hypothetical protein